MSNALNVRPSTSGRVYHGRGIPYTIRYINRLKEVKHVLPVVKKNVTLITIYHLLILSCI